MPKVDIILLDGLMFTPEALRVVAKQILKHHQNKSNLRVWSIGKPLPFPKKYVVKEGILLKNTIFKVHVCLLFFFCIICTKKGFELWLYSIWNHSVSKTIGDWRRKSQCRKQLFIFWMCLRKHLRKTIFSFVLRRAKNSYCMGWPFFFNHLLVKHWRFGGKYSSSSKKSGSWILKSKQKM